LIISIVSRNDYYYGEFGLFYQIFRYWNWKNLNENNIYSNGVLWSLYKYYFYDDLTSFEKLLENKYYYKERLIYELNRSWEIENIFYSEMEHILLDEKNIENIITEEFNHDLLEDYLAYIWINKEDNSKYYPYIKKHIDGTLSRIYELQFSEFLEELHLRFILPKNVLNATKSKIFQCGCLKNENKYLKTTLSEYLQKNLKEQSCYIYPELLGYLRINNKLKIDFDYSEIFKYFNMYSFRKDYSVESMPQALLIFEKYGCISEEKSLKLILNTMGKSEKGIRHLSLDYCSEKDSEIIEKLSKKFDLEFDSEINYYDVEIINKFPETIVFKNFFDFNKGKEIDFTRINALLKSKHGEKILRHIKMLKLIAYNVPKEFEEIFKENNIDYKLNENNDDNNHSIDNLDLKITERGYLRIDDLEKIKKK